MIAVYLSIVFFSLILILVTPVKINNKTFVALKNLQFFNSTAIGSNLVNFSVSAKIDEGVLMINDSRVRLRKRNIGNSKKLPIMAFYKIFKAEKISVSVFLGSTRDAATLAVVQGMIIMLFDLINNTREGKVPKFAANLTVLQDRNIAEIQLSIAVKINLFMIIRAILLILFSEVRK